LLRLLLYSSAVAGVRGCGYVGCVGYVRCGAAGALLVPFKMCGELSYIDGKGKQCVAQLQECHLLVA